MKTLGRAALGAIVAMATPMLSGCPADETPPSGDAGTEAGAECAPDPKAPAEWQVVFSDGDLDRSLLSIWGASPTDVYAVGGSLGNGRESLVVHFDGCAWKPLAPGGTETYWWVSGSGPSDVWMVGEKGRITHWNGEAFEEHESGTTSTLWGVFAFAPDDAWAVGGMPGTASDEPDDVVLHWDGSAWAPADPSPEPKKAALYKVWGTSSDDLYVVGEFGVIWHKKGATWTLESDPPLAQGTLFTVYGCSGNDVYAVGGNDVLHSDGAAWTKLDVELNSGVNGVTCGRPGEVLLVGFGGLKQRLVDGAWVDEFTIQPWSDLHGSWADGAGTFWAAGGQFVTPASPMEARDGVIGRYGPGQVGDTLP